MLLHSNSVYISQKLAITNMISFVFNVITLHRSIVGIIIATSNMKQGDWRMFDVTAQHGRLF